MKRYGNLFQKVIAIDNLNLADRNARKGKGNQRSLILHDQQKESNILALHDILKNGTYQTSKYETFIIREPKERLIYRLPYFPDRITHHAIMNVIKPIFISTFTADTYSCIKNRGIHKAVQQIKYCLKDSINTSYYLKIDIKKFYQTVDNNILKQLLHKKFKDMQLLKLLNSIIDSSQGLPIGNYLSQYLANYYLAFFDHWIKEVLKVKYYFRYADDMVFFSDCKKFLHSILHKIKAYLKENLALELKPNYKISPIICGLDFLGYVFFENHTRIRKSIKKQCARMLTNSPNLPSIYSYLGWFSHANTINLQNKLIYGRT